jgi:uncharacterized protein (DUF1684 family)
MKQLCRLFMLLTVCLLVNTIVFGQTQTPYQKELETWHTNRIKALKAENGWLNMVGLYWLPEGKSSFGSGSQNNIIFPKGSIADAAGYVERTGNTVKLIPATGAGIAVNGSAVNAETIIFDDGEGKTPVVSAGSLQWTIIKRDNKIGIRLRDLKSPQVNSFSGIDRFEVDTTWRIPAKLQAESQASNIFITNVIGQTTAQKSPGKLVFTVNNQQYTLDALEEGDELFIIFGDATSGQTTYPSGRFLSVKKPGADGITVIDFNKAYNPPCAFTDYATCPLPPKQNILPIPITAGEKNYGHHLK